LWSFGQQVESNPKPLLALWLIGLYIHFHDRDMNTEHGMFICE
jgi:hypothetical protein